MNAFEHIKRCFELTERDIATAVETRDGARELLGHLSEISEPNGGAAKSLLLLARMATSACEWLDGELRVEIVGDHEISVVEVQEDLGGGMRERVFQPLPFKAPLDEFSRAVERVPHMVSPLSILAKTTRHITLGATAEAQRSSLLPPPIQIAEESFFVPVDSMKIPATSKAGPAPELPVVTPQLPLVVSEQRRAQRESSRPPQRGATKLRARVPSRPPVPPPPTKVALERPPLPRPKPRAEPPVVVEPPPAARVDTRRERDDENEVDAAWGDEEDAKKT